MEVFEIIRLSLLSGMTTLGYITADDIFDAETKAYKKYNKVIDSDIFYAVKVGGK